MRRLEWYGAAVLTVALGLAAWGCAGLTRHAIVAVDQVGDAAKGISQTAALLNGKHGTIAMANEDVGAAKSLIVHGDLVARHEQQQLTTWDVRGTELFNNVNGAVTDLRGTVTASTGLVQEATKTAQTLNDPKTGIGVTLAETNKTIPEIHRTATAAANTLENTAQVTKDGAKVADHLEQTIDHPKKSPWYIRWLPQSVQTAIDILIHFM